MPDNTHKFRHPEHYLEAVVGDEKQPDFKPRLKIKKWDNEVNFSVGLQHEGGKVTKTADRIIYDAGDHEAHFYHKPAAIRHSTHLRWLDLGEISPVDVTAEYELSRHVPSTDITVATYTVDQPSVMYFGSYHAKQYVTDVDIPQVRAASSDGNPYYMDNQLVMIDVHFNQHTFENAQDVWNEAVKQVLREQYGIHTYNKGAKLYYRDTQGRDVKIASPQTDQGHLWTYLNIDTLYTQVYDYYRPDIEKNIRDPYAYGLRKTFPKVEKSIIKTIVQRFATLAELQLYSSAYTPEETKALNRIRPILASEEWVQDAQRPDAGWHYEHSYDGFEFEIHLKQKPASNIIPLSVQLKDVLLLYQPELTDEEKLGSYRPPHIVGSYALYHANMTPDKSVGEKSHKYRVGKIGHIHRPWIQDADGNKVWAELDYHDDQLDIVLPQAFLDSATYPVIVDPTFGYTVTGATVNSSDIVNKMSGSTFAGADGFLQSLTANVATVAGSGEARAAVYQLNGYTLVDTGSVLVFPAGGWNTFYGFSNTLLSSAQTYGLVVWGNNLSYQSIAHDTATNMGITNATAYSRLTPWPVGGTAFTLNNNLYSIYATYTDPAGTTTSTSTSSTSTSSTSTSSTSISSTSTSFSSTSTSISSTSTSISSTSTSFSSTSQSTSSSTSSTSHSTSVSSTSISSTSTSHSTTSASTSSTSVSTSSTSSSTSTSTTTLPPIAYRQAATGVNSASAKSVTTSSFPWGVLNSSAIIVTIGVINGQNDVKTVADSAGNTYQKIASRFISSNFDLEIWVAYNVRGRDGLTVTATHNARNSAIIAREYVGFDNFSPFDVSATATDAGRTGGLLDSGNTPVTSQATEMVFGAGLSASGAGPVFSEDGMMQNLVQQNVAASFAIATEDDVVSTTGQYKATFFSSVTTSNWIAIVATFASTSILGTTTSTSSSTSTSSTSTSTSTSISTSSTSSSTSSTSTSTSTSLSTSSTSTSTSSTSTSTSTSTSSTSTSISTSSTSSSTSISTSSTSSSISTSSTSSSTSVSTSTSSTSSSISTSTSLSTSSTSSSTSVSTSSTSSSISTSSTSASTSISTSSTSSSTSISLSTSSTSSSTSISTSSTSTSISTSSTSTSVSTSSTSSSTSHSTSLSSTSSSISTSTSISTSSTSSSTSLSTSSTSSSISTSSTSSSISTSTSSTSSSTSTSFSTSSTSSSTSLSTSSTSSSLSTSSTSSSTSHSTSSTSASTSISSTSSSTSTTASFTTSTSSTSTSISVSTSTSSTSSSTSISTSSTSSSTSTSMSTSSTSSSTSHSTSSTSTSLSTSTSSTSVSISTSSTSSSTSRSTSTSLSSTSLSTSSSTSVSISSTSSSTSSTQSFTTSTSSTSTSSTSTSTSSTTTLLDRGFVPRASIQPDSIRVKYEYTQGRVKRITGRFR